MSLLPTRLIISSSILRREISSAYARRLMAGCSKVTPSDKLIYLNTLFNTKLNNTGENAPPCLSPILTSIGCDVTFAN